jgi:hypothetical protein
MTIPYIVIIDLLVIIFFILAVLTAERKGKLILTGIMALLFALPYLFHVPLLSWVIYFAKIIFGLSCYFFIRWHGLL